MSGSRRLLEVARTAPRRPSTCASTVSSSGGGEVELDLEGVVAGELDDRADLDDGVELDVAVLLARGDLDLGRGDRVEVLGDDGVGVEVGQPVLQRLLARDLGAEAGFEDAAGCLAGPEAGDPHLAGQLAERGVDRGLELWQRGRQRGA